MNLKKIRIEKGLSVPALVELSGTSPDDTGHRKK